MRSTFYDRQTSCYLRAGVLYLSGVVPVVELFPFYLLLLCRYGTDYDRFISRTAFTPTLLHGLRHSLQVSNFSFIYCRVITQ